MLSLLSPEVHDRLLRFVDVEGEVNSLAPLNVVVLALSVLCGCCHLSRVSGLDKL